MMKLFGDFEAVKFCEENLILVTHNGYLYYIFDCKNRYWKKYRNAGNDHLSVNNYPDVDKEEIIDAMKGKLPQKETDFMRMCNPCQLWIRDMLEVLIEDYSCYMSDKSIYHTVHRFLLESDIRYKAYLELRKLFDNANSICQDNHNVLGRVKELSYTVIGRDIYKKEIGIVDGHDTSSYFWIQPVRVIDYSDTNDMDNVAEMSSAEISIEEDDVDQYLTPFLYKYYDDELEANKKRKDASDFEWYLTHNFYTYDAVRNILEDIKDTIDALSSGRNTEYTEKLKIKRGTETYQLVYAKNLTEDEIEEYNRNRPKEDDTEIGLIIDFYNRFVYRMEYMMKVGNEKGYDLISFMGP